MSVSVSSYLLQRETWEVERNGREQSKRPAEWALGSQSNTAGSNAREVIGKGARSGYLPRILDFFFHGTG